MRLRTLCVAIVATVGLSGCLGAGYGTGTSRTYIDPLSYQANEKGYAGIWDNYTMARRNVNTEILGNPFNMDKEVFDLVAAQIMTDQQPAQLISSPPLKLDQSKGVPRTCRRRTADSS